MAGLSQKSTTLYITKLAAKYRKAEADVEANIRSSGSRFDEALSARQTIHECFMALLESISDYRLNKAAHEKWRRLTEVKSAFPPNTTAGGQGGAA